jgi:hypothetical protein
MNRTANSLGHIRPYNNNNIQTNGEEFNFSVRGDCDVSIGGHTECLVVMVETRCLVTKLGFQLPYGMRAIKFQSSDLTTL